MRVSREKVVRFFALTAIIMCYPTRGATQKLSEGRLEPQPATPSITERCQDLSRPNNGSCDIGYFQALVSGQSRCVPKCDGSLRAFNLSCPAGRSDNQCPSCSRDCSTCAFHKVQFDNLGSNFDGQIVKGFNSTFEVFNGRPSCIDAKRSASESDWSTLPSGLKNNTMKYLDDQVMARALTRFKGIIGEVSYNPAPRESFCSKEVFTGINTSHPPRYLRCSYRCPVGSNSCETAASGAVYSPLCHNYEGKCTEGYFFVDNNCDTVEVSSGEERECSVSLAAKINYIASSPISLVWSRKTDLLKAYSLVRFPLDLSSVDRWYAWHASADAPLLVYDPSHSGVINSPQQLFGNWTFGGQRSASYSAEGPAVVATPWRDGYEALATLDQDGDGAIAAQELTPLGLWFDRNQDGVSQPGEVRPIVNTGVTRLFTGPTTKVTSIRAVKVERGFIREDENGHMIEGETIDWYGDGARTVSELMARQDFHASVSTRIMSAAPLLPSETPSISWAMGALVPESPLNGRWVWSDPRDESKLEHGALELEERRGGGIAGLALAQVNLDSDVSMRHAVVFKVINGGITKRDKNKIEFTFHSVDTRGANGSKPSVETTATLDRKASVLSGTTTQYVGEGESQRKVTYAWIARRGDRGAAATR